MTQFAFYGRVSTEDQQDPVASRNWQLDRARALIDPHAGVIVEEFFDIGTSRSLPWKRRPEALRLLESLRDPLRGFTAVVIGEPARAFYGQQFGLTFPVLTHFGVALWVPEVGGPVDPGSEAHDIVMSLYGGMSKGERNRIKLRVRTAMASQAQIEGRYLGGRPPYGYRLADAGVHPNPGKAADGKRLRKLEIDSVTAPIVERIFTEWLGGRGMKLIAEGLSVDGVPSPSAYDRARNPHRAGVWTHTAVRAILQNPRYTGYGVWNRQRKVEELLDPEDVALGERTLQRWNQREEWIWSKEPTHPAIVSIETFRTAQAFFVAPASDRQPRPRPTERSYVLRGVLRCGVCGRRMEGTWNHGRAHYRCKASPQHPDHPRTVYVREAAVTGPVDEWLASFVSDPANVDGIIEAMHAAQGPTDADLARAEELRRTIADCETKISRYRGQLEKGGPTALIGQWLEEVDAERTIAQADLDALLGNERPELTKAEIAALTTHLRSAIRLLAKATPQQRAEVYNDLGVELVYHPGRRTIEAVANLPCTRVRVGGGT